MTRTSASILAGISLCLSPFAPLATGKPRGKLKAKPTLVEVIGTLAVQAKNGASELRLDGEDGVHYYIAIDAQSTPLLAKNNQRVKVHAVLTKKLTRQGMRHNLKLRSYTLLGRKSEN